MMKTLQNIWKHKREFQINIFSFIRKIRICRTDKLQITNKLGKQEDGKNGRKRKL